MKSSIFFEFVISISDLAAIDLSDRWHIEEQLEERLRKENLGEITGGGTGMGNFNIDIELDLDHVEQGLQVVRAALQYLNIPESTTLRDSRTDEYVPIF